MTKRTEWARATDPQPDRECPKCGESGPMIDLVDTPRHPMMYCNVCGTNWRVSPRKGDHDADH